MEVVVWELSFCQCTKMGFASFRRSIYWLSLVFCSSFEGFRLARELFLLIFLLLLTLQFLKFLSMLSWSMTFLARLARDLGITSVASSGWRVVRSVLHYNFFLFFWPWRPQGYVDQVRELNAVGCSITLYYYTQIITRNLTSGQVVYQWANRTLQ